MRRYWSLPGASEGLESKVLYNIAMSEHYKHDDGEDARERKAREKYALLLDVLKNVVSVCFPNVGGDVQIYQDFSGDLMRVLQSDYSPDELKQVHNQAETILLNLDSEEQFTKSKLSILIFQEIRRSHGKVFFPQTRENLKLFLTMVSRSAEALAS